MREGVGGNTVRGDDVIDASRVASGDGPLPLPEHAPTNGTASAAAPGQRHAARDAQPRVTTEFRPFARLDNVDAAAVRLALQLLRVHNHLYSDIVIDEAMLQVVDRHHQAVLAAGGPLAATVPVQEVFLETSEQLANSLPEAAAVPATSAPVTRDAAMSLTADTAARVMASLSTMTSGNAMMDAGGVLRVQLQPMRSSAIGAGRHDAAGAPPTAPAAPTSEVGIAADVPGTTANGASSANNTTATTATTTTTAAAAAAAAATATAGVAGDAGSMHNQVPDAVREAEAIRFAYWADPYLLPKAYPALFPDGLGGPPVACAAVDGVSDDQAHCNFADYCKYLLQHYTRQFERCQPFMFFVAEAAAYRWSCGTGCCASQRTTHWCAHNQQPCRASSR